MSTTMVLIILGPDVPTKEAGPGALRKDACPDGEAKESSSGPSAKKPNSENITVEEKSPNNETKEFDQNELMNRTGPISSTNEISSKIPAKAKETEPTTSSKRSDADIVAKETDAHSLKKADAPDLTTDESIPSESITERGPKVPTNGTGPDIFTSTTPTVLRKDAGPLVPTIEKSPTLDTEGPSSDTSMKNKTGIDVASKKHDARSDLISKETVPDLPTKEVTPRTDAVSDFSGNLKADTQSSNGHTSNSKPSVIPLLSDSDPRTANGTYH